jgi:DNA-binding transcriptional LysR family regulator
MERMPAGSRPPDATPAVGEDLGPFEDADGATEAGRPEGILPGEGADGGGTVGLDQPEAAGRRVGGRVAQGTGGADAVGIALEKGKVSGHVAGAHVGAGGVVFEQNDVEHGVAAFRFAGRQGQGMAARLPAKAAIMPRKTAKSQAPNWNDLRYLLAVAQGGTLAAAARRLRVDETTVARRLAAAEAALDVRLFERLDGAMRPTPAGEAAIAHAERIEREVQALHGRIGGADAAVAGTVRLTSVPIVVNRLLVPALPSLVAAHPLLRLELIAEPRNLSLTKRAADIALRLARPQGGGTVVARRIGRLDYAVYGPRDGNAGALPWITYEEGLDELPQAKWIAAATRGAAMPPTLMAGDAETILAAVRAGLGKSLLPCAVAEREPGLRRLGDAVVLSRELWLLVHADLRRLARIEAVIGWIERTIRKVTVGRQTL